ncbi:MAG: uracil-DNA glycosylase family protein [Tannerella sp.]|jgi:G:T/U-mismatch repair DNA glycosylase|nr:uracil-DNA glycosylase family protein [Tannerella sp.]
METKKNKTEINGETEKHPLQPFLPQNATILMLGSFPPPRARWTMNFYYPNFQNDMWRIFGLIFFEDADYFVAENKTFDESGIRSFLTEKGIALYDTATEVIRLRGNASDNFLQTVKPTDIAALLAEIPLCNTIVTTGQKATDTLMAVLGVDTPPSVGGYIETVYNNRRLRCYRMPSSSRAYPKPLKEKAADYSAMLNSCGLM